MTGAGPLAQGHDQTELTVVQLACTACQLVYEPNLAAFDTGNTGCPRCGGWTWIAYLGASPSGKETLR